MSTKNALKIKSIFFCEKCNFKTYKKSDFERHLSTLKHYNQHLATTNTPKNNIICFECLCGKRYNDRTGLWRHKKKCILLNEKENCNALQLIMETIKENKEIKDFLIEQNNKLMEQNAKLIEQNLNHNNTNITNITNNSNNNTFNLNIFLNEKCKNAMNIMDFVGSIKHTVQDVNNIGTYGYVEGISKLFIRNLKLLSVYERPIHCSDVKREVLYIKDSDKWEKDENKSLIIKAIKKVDFDNIRNIDNWKKENPNCTDVESKQNDQYNYIITQSMSGQDTYYDKIISNVSKKVIIDKN